MTNNVSSGNGPPPRSLKRTKAVTELPAAAVHMLFALRTTALVAAEPLDHVARLLNGKRGLPSLSLRRYAGPLGTMEASAGEFLAYLKLLCRAKSDARILDIGCGFGLMALALDSYLDGSGLYVGLDINRRAINWATRRFSSKPRFAFHHLDVRNGMYNPNGLSSADAVVLPVEPQSFDVVLLKSVFTHMRPHEVRNYLHQVQAVLSPTGTCLATFFLLNDAQQTYEASGLSHMTFAFGNDEMRYAVRDVPEIAVAYRDESVAEMVDEADLKTEHIYYGSWSGRPDGLSYQDIALLTKRHP
jgi:ubiquinone/menaquinone biosynthesis C-methylase UbiE